MNKRKKIYRVCLVAIMIVVSTYTFFYINNLVNKQTPTNEKTRIASRVPGDSDMIMPIGMQIGVYLETEGVLVAGTSSITGEDGLNYEPVLNKVYEGDYIEKINNIEVSSKGQLLFLVNKYGDEDIVLTVQREGEVFDVSVTPIKTDTNEYKIGIWVRDDTQGIGTLTYITKDGKFGALGHGINDVDTKKLLDSHNGLLYEATIWGINKSTDGKPGGLLGNIDYEKENELGTIEANSNKGIYGTIYQDKIDEIINKYNIGYYQVASKSEIQVGEATIITCIDGSAKEYDVEIISVDLKRGDNKGMVLQVTDEELLELTNGIVQGMSGSPIIQNNKVIGAITHVFVDEPTKGYGIFIESMLNSGN